MTHYYTLDQVTTGRNGIILPNNMHAYDQELIDEEHTEEEFELLLAQCEPIED